MSGYSPDALRHLYNRLQAEGYPKAQLAGIYNGSVYGYHNCRANLSPQDYSVQRPDDKVGDASAGSGLDITMHDPADMARMTQRLIDLTQARDSRVQCLREFFGTVNGYTVTGMDVRDVRWVTSDDSHLWHVHISAYRKFATDTAAMDAVASAILGTSGGIAPPKDELPPEVEAMLLQDATSKVGMLVTGGRAVFVRNGDDYNAIKAGGVPAAMVSKTLFDNVAAAMGGARG